MRNCRVVPVHKVEGRDFMWEWRSIACDRRSSRRFVLFHDCVKDARDGGFTVLLDQATGDMAPGRHSLR